MHNFRMPTWQKMLDQKRETQKTTPREIRKS